MYICLYLLRVFFTSFTFSPLLVERNAMMMSKAENCNSAKSVRNHKSMRTRLLFIGTIVEIAYGNP